MDALEIASENVKFGFGFGRCGEHVAIEEGGDSSASGVAGHEEGACGPAWIFGEEVTQAGSDGTNHFSCY